MLSYVFIFGTVLWTGLAICRPSHSHKTRLHDDGRAALLRLHATVQSSMMDPSSLSLLTTLVNESNTTFTVISDPDGLLNTLPTHKFDFYKQYRQIGRSQRTTTTRVAPSVNAYDSNVAAALSDPERHISLRAGENTSVIHDLYGIYAFKESGLYTIKLASGAKYLRVVEKNKSSAEYARIRAHNDPKASWATTVYISDAAVRSSLKQLNNQGATRNLLSNANDSRPLYRRYSSRNCDQKQQAAIASAIRSAHWYIGESNKFLDHPRTAQSRRYKSWFGNPDAVSQSGIRKRFKLLNGQPGRFQYDCSCQRPGVFAFVRPFMFGVVNLCPAFWEAPITGVDSKAGTLVHEATHFPQLGRTQDYVFGAKEAFALAKKSPKHAVSNADNYEYFSEYFRLR